jgi:hypothetical protein
VTGVVRSDPVRSWPGCGLSVAPRKRSRGGRPSPRLGRRVTSSTPTGTPSQPSSPPQPGGSLAGVSSSWGSGSRRSPATRRRLNVSLGPRGELSGTGGSGVVGSGPLADLRRRQLDQAVQRLRQLQGELDQGRKIAAAKRNDLEERRDREIAAMRDTVRESGGLLLRIRALSALTLENSAVSLAMWIIRLAIMLIDSMPSSSGSYNRSALGDPMTRCLARYSKRRNSKPNLSGTSRTGRRRRRRGWPVPAPAGRLRSYP